MAPALLTLPSSERLRARVKASEEVEATEATAAICIVMASWHRAIGNRREALGDRDFLASYWSQVNYSQPTQPGMRAPGHLPLETRSWSTRSQGMIMASRLASLFL